MTDYIILPFPHDFKNSIIYFFLISRVNESNSIKHNSLETIDKIVLSEQTKFRLSEIIGIGNYFYQEINQRKP